MMVVEMRLDTYACSSGRNCLDNGNSSAKTSMVKQPRTSQAGRSHFRPMGLDLQLEPIETMETVILLATCACLSGLNRLLDGCNLAKTSTERPCVMSRAIRCHYRQMGCAWQSELIGMMATVIPLDTCACTSGCLRFPSGSNSAETSTARRLMIGQVGLFHYRWTGRGWRSELDPITTQVLILDMFAYMSGLVHFRRPDRHRV